MPRLATKVPRRISPRARMMSGTIQSSAMFGTSSRTSWSLKWPGYSTRRRTIGDTVQSQKVQVTSSQGERLR